MDFSNRNKGHYFGFPLEFISNFSLLFYQLLGSKVRYSHTHAHTRVDSEQLTHAAGRGCFDCSAARSVIMTCVVVPKLILIQLCLPFLIFNYFFTLLFLARKVAPVKRFDRRPQENERCKKKKWFNNKIPT